MVSEKPWKLDAVVLLMLGVLLGLSLGALLAQTLERLLPEGVSWDQNYTSFVLNSVSFHGVALVLLGIFLRHHGLRWRDFLGLTGSRSGRAIGWGLLVGMAVLPLALGLNKLSFYAVSLLTESPAMQTPVRVLRESVTLGQRVSFGIAAVLLAPMVEEVLFRGILYTLLKQQGFPKLALWGSSLLFALIHCNAITFVPLTFLAVALVWLYERTDSLLAPIVAHSLFNAANFFLLVFEEGVNQWTSDLLRGLGF